MYGGLLLVEQLEQRERKANTIRGRIPAWAHTSCRTNGAVGRNFEGNRYLGQGVWGNTPCRRTEEGQREF